MGILIKIYVKETLLTEGKDPLLRLCDIFLFTRMRAYLSFYRCSKFPKSMAFVRDL